MATGSNNIATITHSRILSVILSQRGFTTWVRAGLIAGSFGVPSSGVMSGVGPFTYVEDVEKAI